MPIDHPNWGTTGRPTGPRHLSWSGMAEGAIDDLIDHAGTTITAGDAEQISLDAVETVGGGGIRCDGWVPTTQINTRNTGNIAVAVEFTWPGEGLTHLFGAWGSADSNRGWAVVVTGGGVLRFQRLTSSGAYFSAGLTLPGPGSYVARVTETSGETVLVVDGVGQTTSANNRNEGANAGPIQIAPDGGGSGATSVVHRAALWSNSGDTLIAAVDLRQKWPGQTMTDIADTVWTLTGPAPNWVMAPRF